MTEEISAKWETSKRRETSVSSLCMMIDTTTLILCVWAHFEYDCVLVL